MVNPFYLRITNREFSTEAAASHVIVPAGEKIDWQAVRAATDDEDVLAVLANMPMTNDGGAWEWYARIHFSKDWDPALTVTNSGATTTREIHIDCVKGRYDGVDRVVNDLATVGAEKLHEIANDVRHGINLLFYTGAATLVVAGVFAYLRH